MSRVDLVALARQPAGRGVAPTTPMEYQVPVISSEPAPDRQTLEQDETLGSRFPSGIEYGTGFNNIPIRALPHAASFPRLLSAFLCQPDHTAVAPDHQWVLDPVLAGKIPEWHSVFVVRRDPKPDPIVDLFYNARGNEFSLEVAANGFLTFTGTLLALSLDDTQADPVVAGDTSKRWTFLETLVYLSVEGGAEAAVPCASWGMDYSNGFDTDEAVLGSRDLYDLPVGNANSTVRFSPRADLPSYYRRALEIEPESVKVRMVALSADGHRKLEVTTYASEETEAPAPIDASTTLKAVDVVARAKLDPSTGKFVKVTVLNQVATYA
jgi:hypothetical protein